MSATEIVITAAGCVTDWGCGSHRSAPRSWDDLPGGAGAGPRPPAFAWSSLFASPCPRFGRMDPLCRLGLASVEMMGIDFAALVPDERAGTAVCLGTPEGSLSVDVDFWRGRDGAGGPNPTLFTYTLPSTLLGEICIRHGLKGPNLCLMLGDAGSGRLLQGAAEWLRRGEVAACACVLANAVEGVAASRAEPTSTGPGRSFACALFLERRDDAARRNRPALRPLPAGAAGIRDLCESLCGVPPRA